MPFVEKDQYCALHDIQMLKNERRSVEENIIVHVSEDEDLVELKIQNPSDYKFRFTGRIDPTIFKDIITKHSLNLNFDDFGPYLIELLYQAKANEILLRLRFEDDCPILTFYGKINKMLKTVVEINLLPTGLNEKIQELSAGLTELAEKCKELEEIMENMEI